MLRALLHGIKTTRTDDGGRLSTLRADGIPWNIKKAPERIIGIGDVHGDIVGFASILYELGVIAKTGSWQGGGTHVVLNGDLVGGRNARLLLRMIRRLKAEAAPYGGAVHCLLGNHDVQVFSKRYQKREGKTLFQKYPVKNAGKPTVKHAFSQDTELARWTRERNAVTRIGDTLFAHAGLNVWALRHHVKRINATVRAWIRYWQGVGDPPDPSTEWAALGPESDWSAPFTGPLWTRSFRVPQNRKAADRDDTGAPTVEEIDRVLRKYRVRRMVVAHNPNPESEILLEHPKYGDRVIMIDTRISDRKKGRLSCIDIQGDEVLVHYPKRRKTGENIKKRELKRLKKR
jgi:predicted MPP superfamily phosphohydrolase